MPPDHLIEDGYEPIDVVHRVDDLNDDGQILAQPEDPGCVKVRACPESFHPSENRRSGEPLGAGSLDQRLIERLALEPVRFADEDAQQLAFSLEFHLDHPPNSNADVDSE